ncbi:hypothetical protein SEA_PATIO_69 [Gordonia phage Patio]|uniref:Uncharacterized protein n=2 Tax=Skysandvirus TaxID=2948912 RepID=A0A2D2W4M9_9CAUD|nr:hypothetical protein KNT76_gp69 [Gordonia phage Patio]YP_010103178.1 hypothetical protein KNU64_gp71 [Gordonia Phage Lollipop1437]ATS93150.1 hypothetical protein SEA_PATIO_69 [Gordonia phage Patio]QDF19175.1 hypothetical protein SEA_LOLLIPOP1437_71 [Gordonia Phage Lollipop1437]QRI45309.1 hypothetical protein SEA_ENNEA_74 [Gordonia phage Ennea]
MTNPAGAWPAHPVQQQWPPIEFLYLDDKHPNTPSHVWWSTKAFGVDPKIWHTAAELEISLDEPARFRLSELVLIDNLPEHLATDLPKLRLMTAKVRLASAFIEAGEKIRGATRDF